MKAIIHLVITVLIVALMSGPSAAASMAACDTHGEAHQASSQQMHETVTTEMMNMDCCDPDNPSQCADCTCPTHMCSSSVAAFSPGNGIMALNQQSEQSNFASGQLAQRPDSLFRPPIHS
ncbi:MULTISPECIES: hypothetical protein [unclassified Pseudoalteromonas]|uniref:hypothetical protein n=1 Tax=unclassified Pseudoalteromonas TaxID=194690 RepID=UPI00301520CA